MLNVTAILHDIGIKKAEEIYQSSSGKYQEKLGPEIAAQLLQQFPDVSKEESERIQYLIGHHHTYNNIKDIDYQILVEADFLVNIYEDQLPFDNIIKVRENIFKTQTGIQLINTIYLS